MGTHTPQAAALNMLRPRLKAPGILVAPPHSTEMPAIDRPSPIAAQIERVLRGEARATEALYSAHVGRVFRYCLAFTRGDRACAQDLCQESFTRALSSLHTLHDPERFSGWLMTITRRTCLRWIEDRQRESKALTLYAAEPHDQHTEPTHVEAAVAEVIAACPDERLREVAALFYRSPAHTTHQIAAHLDVSQTAVTTRLHRFRSWVKRRMLSRLSETMEENPWST